MYYKKTIIVALAILFAGQAYALDAGSSDYISVDIANATNQPEQMTLPHSFVAEMRERNIATIENGVIRPFACTIKGAGVTAHITGRDQAEVDWTLNAMRDQGATAKIITTIDPDAPEVKIDVTRTVAGLLDPACPAMAAMPATVPETITLQHDFVQQFGEIDRRNVEIIFVRQAAKTLRTPAVVAVNITARDQAEADLVAFTYRRNGATAPFTTSIDPAAAEVRMVVVRAEQQ